MPVYHWGVGGDRSKGFLHLTFAAGNDTPGRTAAVRRNAAEVLGDAIDDFVGDLGGLESVTVHVQDIDRDRGYTTTASRRKRRAAETESELL
jgi:5-carboxymethyl-2-hydroxymuconate isomerase